MNVSLASYFITGSITDSRESMWPSGQTLTNVAGTSCNDHKQEARLDVCSMYAHTGRISRWDSVNQDDRPGIRDLDNQGGADPKNEGTSEGIVHANTRAVSRQGLRADGSAQETAEGTYIAEYTNCELQSVDLPLDMGAQALQGDTVVKEHADGDGKL